MTKIRTARKILIAEKTSCTGGNAYKTIHFRKRDKDNTTLKTYILEASSLAKIRSGRECMEFINDYTKTCHQPGMPMKCPGMLLKLKNGNSRVTKLDLDGKEIIHQIFLYQCGIVQGTRNDPVEGRRRDRCHINAVSATGGTVEGKGN